MAKTAPDKTTAERLADAYANLTEQVEQLFTSKRWDDYLRLQARLHTYSWRNTLLIGQQCPDAEMVASFRKWKELGRIVKKGEKALWILGPARYKATATAADGTESEVEQVRGFKPVPVFDVSQTEGAELAAHPAQLLQGDAPEWLLEALRTQIEEAGFTYRRDIWADARNGFTDYASREVVVRADLTEAQAAKTTAHELGHIMCGHETATYERGQKELEAESFARIVCLEAGLDTDGFSLGYVATWAGQEDAVATLQACATTVQRAARQVIVRKDDWLALQSMSPAERETLSVLRADGMAAPDALETAGMIGSFVAPAPASAEAPGPRADASPADQRVAAVLSGIEQRRAAQSEGADRGR